MSVDHYLVVKDVILIIYFSHNYQIQDMIIYTKNKHRFLQFRRKILKRQLLNYIRIYHIVLFLLIGPHIVVKYKD